MSHLAQTAGFILAAMLGLSACTDEKPAPPPPPPPKETPKPTPEPRPKTDPSDPFQPEDPKVLFELFEARSLPGRAQFDVYRRYKLVREDGSPDKKRQTMFRQALRDYATAHPDAWGDFVDRLGEDR